MNAYRRYCITHEPALSARADMAALYRKMRRERPEMARLLYRQCKYVENKLSELIYTGLHTNQSGGLQDLLK